MSEVEVEEQGNAGLWLYNLVLVVERKKKGLRPQKLSPSLTSEPHLFFLWHRIRIVQVSWKISQDYS